MLREVLHQGEIASLDGDTLIFRHDRVRDWLLAEAIAEDMAAERLAAEIS